MQVTETTDSSKQLRIEWVGESRNVEDGTVGQQDSSTGRSEIFDIVVMATGFGLEDGGSSYWRNETVGQPSLDRPMNSFVISGQGDGAIIDLLRLRISQFRQDRILYELFGDKLEIVNDLKSIQKKFGSSKEGLFNHFEELFSSVSKKDETEKILTKLKSRLRRDTEVILCLLVDDIAELLKPATSRMSFQNAVLVYLLYKCGGFAPSGETAQVVKKRCGIPDRNHIKRHGTDPIKVLLNILSKGLKEKCEKQTDFGKDEFALQSSLPQWPGGYFGHVGPTSYLAKIPNVDRRKWRKEYFPGPTAALATSICGSIAAAIRRLEKGPKQFRVTLHRTFSIGDEPLLQQANDYQGDGLEDQERTAGRTYPYDFATIGYANQSRKIVRKCKNAGSRSFTEAMQKETKRAAREMRSEVQFVAAIPLTAPREDRATSDVVAVLYVDREVARQNCTAS